MKKRARSEQRVCAHCQGAFVPDPRVRDRQRFCRRAACAKASKAAAQKRWLGKPENRAHFRGAVNLLRSQAWRKANPGYWRRRVRIGSRVVRGRLAEVIRRFALQDSIDSLFCLLIGLVSHLSRRAQQDTIANEIRRLMLRGNDILEDITVGRRRRRTGAR